MSRKAVLHRRAWNGYGLSIWACKCGARRTATPAIHRAATRALGAEAAY